MYTGIYYPNDPVDKYGIDVNKVCWLPRDMTELANGLGYNEGPSYCVRLLVFEMPDD